MISLPEPNMEQLDEINLKTSYAKLFKCIQEDFVTKYDLQNILATLMSSPTGGKVAYIPTFGVGQSLVKVYEALVRAGKAGIKSAVAAGKAAIGI